MALLDTDVIGPQSAGSYQVIGYLSILSEYGPLMSRDCMTWYNEGGLIMQIVFALR